MVSYDRTKVSDLASELNKNGHEWSFVTAIRTIENIMEGEEVGLTKRPKFESIRFRSNPSLGFPASDIKKIDFFDNEREGLGKFDIMVNFMGLSGASSPLPGFYLEEVSREADEQKLAVLRPFFDFFSHRTISFIYRAWKKYRYYENFKPRASDKFSKMMFSMIGIDQRLMDMEPNIQWSRLLAYSGFICSKRRSPEILSSVLKHAFDIDDINVIEYVYREIEIPEDQKWSLGVRNGILGEDVVLCDKIPDISSKFIIQINGLTARQFRRFLPSGDLYDPLRHLVEFMITDQFAYDIELNIIKTEAPPMQLLSHTNENTNHPSNLGWTTFIGQNVKEIIGSVTILGRE